MARWMVAGASRETGSDQSMTITARTRAEAEAIASTCGIMASSTQELPEEAAEPEAPRPPDWSNDSAWMTTQEWIFRPVIMLAGSLLAGASMINAAFSDEPRPGAWLAAIVGILLVISGQLIHLRASVRRSSETVALYAQARSTTDRHQAPPSALHAFPVVPVRSQGR